MSKNRDEEKAVDAVVAEEGKEDQIRETGKEDGAENEEDQAPEMTEKESKRKKKDKVMEAGKGIPTLAGPSVIMVNRAAIIYLAKHLLAPPDLEDFKVAFPSLF